MKEDIKDLPHLVFNGARDCGVLEDKSSKLEKVVKKIGGLCLKPVDYIAISLVVYGKSFSEFLLEKPKERVHGKNIAGRCWGKIGLAAYPR